MKTRFRPDAPPPWAPPRRDGTATLPVADAERRYPADRRRRRWWSLFYGGFRPRRRRPPRRLDDSRFHALDWHSPHLLAVAMGILLLSMADALMTITLLAQGATELNPLMAAVIGWSAAGFAGLKMTLTGMGVILMVSLARYRFMRIVRVEVMMYLALVAYGGLLTYEYWMLGGAIRSASTLTFRGLRRIPYCVALG